MWAGLGKVIGLLSVGQSIGSLGSIGLQIFNKRFFSNLVAAIVFAVLSGVLVATLLIGLHYLLYVTLLDAGLTVLQAALATFATCVALTAGAVATTIYYLRETLDFEVSKPKLNLQRTLQHPEELVQDVASRAASIADAFVDGLFATDPVRAAAREADRAKRAAERRQHAVDRRQQRAAETAIKRAQEKAEKAERLASKLEEPENPPISLRH